MYGADLIRRIIRKRWPQCVTSDDGMARLCPPSRNRPPYEYPTDPAVLRADYAGVRDELIAKGIVAWADAMPEHVAHLRRIQAARALP